MKTPKSILLVNSSLLFILTSPIFFLLWRVLNFSNIAISEYLSWNLGNLVFNTLSLFVVVVISSTALGLCVSILTTRYELFGSKLLFTLSVLPLVIPSYIGALTYLSTNYQGLKSYSMTINVPSEEFENFLEDVEEVSKFKSININSNDVTTQVLDIDSRLKSLNEEKIALEKIKDEATSTSDKLQVQSQLRYINQDIEIYQNQKEYYENATSYSTLSLDIREGSGVTLFSWNYYVQRALMWVEGIVGVSVSLSIIVIPIILLFFLIKKLRKK